MSTKQAVIFAFMVVFLAILLVTLGLWFHFSVDLSARRGTLEALSRQKGHLSTRQAQLREVLENTAEPEKGLKARVQAQKEKADAREKLAFTDATNAVYKLYQEQQSQVEEKWGKAAAGAFEEGAAGKAWKTVYDEWKKENGQIGEAVDRYRTQEKTSATQAQTVEGELRVQLTEEEKQRREIVAKRKKSEDDLAGVRMETEDAQDKITRVTREMEKTPEEEQDGTVLYADEDLKRVTVDLGYDDGARQGLVFTVFSGRHNIPVRKGRIRLAAVRATSSDAVILPEVGVIMYDPVSGWVAPDPGMRYSVFAAAGTEETEPQRLEKLRSKRELIQEMREEKARVERGQEAETPAETVPVQAQPPLVQGKGFQPIVPGDWLSNTAFVRIVPQRRFERQVADEILAARDVSLGPLTFYFADNIRPFRREFLRRLCERNDCRATRQMSSDVDYLVTTPDATRLEVMEDRLRDIPEEKRANEAELAPEVAERVRVLKALREAKKYGARAISEDQLEALFVQRQRKHELLAGAAIQPGQHTFYVVGETRVRSVRETGLWIKEHGGVLAPALDANVDYVVVGAGLADAKWDKNTHKIYYAGQEAPAGAVSFYEAVRTMGLKILREEELPVFFGRK